MSEQTETIQKRFWEASHGPDEYINAGIGPSDDADESLDVMCQAFADLSGHLERLEAALIVIDYIGCESCESGGVAREALEAE